MSRAHGQALLELAIFGSLLILVLGALINYGLNADFTQQARMRAFRQTLAAASTQSEDDLPASITYQSIDDRRIPDPSNPFAIGSTFPLTASGGRVTKNVRLNDTPDNDAELPRVAVTIQGQPVDCPSNTTCITACRSRLKHTLKVCQEVCQGCTLAGFRNALDVPKSLQSKYEVIYGPLNMTVVGDGACLPPLPPSGICPKAQQTKNLKILDSCEGEIIDYDTCAHQALMFWDVTTCEKECQQGGRSAPECTSICAAKPSTQPSPTQTLPWYAWGATQISFKPPKWKFPMLDGVFNDRQNFGVQPSYTRNTVMKDGSFLDRTEGAATLISPSKTRTQEVIRLEEDTTRTFVFRKGQGTQPVPHVAVGTIPVRSIDDVHSFVDWETSGR